MKRTALLVKKPSPLAHGARFYHERVFNLNNLGQVVQLLPDRKKFESEALYITRCYNEALKIKSDADRTGCFTLFVRGTVMSQNAELRHRTISLFNKNRTSLPTLTDEMLMSLTPGHISLYMNQKFLSHIKKKFLDYESSLRYDVERSIIDQHCTSLYAFQLNSSFYPGLSERLDKQLKLVNKYHLKPSETTDNCASAVSKLLFPDSPVLPENINPMAVAVDVVLKTLEKEEFSKDSDAIRNSLILSGCTRNLHKIAEEEFQNRQALHNQSETQASNSLDEDTPKHNQP